MLIENKMRNKIKKKKKNSKQKKIYNKLKKKKEKNASIYMNPHYPFNKFNLNI